jgi:anti-sigma-K factor RskA
MTAKPVERHAELELCIPYVFGRLNPGNRKQFESHLAGGCDQCNKELSELYEATALLPLLLRQETPSADLRQRILGSASSRPQDEPHPERPRPEQARPERTRPEQNRPERTRADQSRPDRSRSEQPRNERSRSDRSRPDRSRAEQPRQDRQSPPREKPVSPALRSETHWYRYASVILGILIIVALIIFVNDLIGTTGDQSKLITTLQADVRHQEEMLAVLQDPQAEMMRLSAAESSSAAYGKVICDPAKGNALLQVSHLPSLPDGKQYQVWALIEKKYVNAGVLNTAPDSLTTLTMIKVPDGEKGVIEGFAVTAEPKGGSPQPTGSIILRSPAK